MSEAEAKEVGIADAADDAMLDKLVDGIASQVMGYVKKPDWFKARAEELVNAVKEKGLDPATAWETTGAVASSIKRRVKLAMNAKQAGSYPPAKNPDGKRNAMSITIDNTCRAVARWYGELTGMKKPESVWEPNALSFFASHKNDLAKLEEFARSIVALIEAEKAKPATEDTESDEIAE